LLQSAITTIISKKGWDAFRKSIDALDTEVDPPDEE
jgi:hypothetical protein